MLLLLAVVMLLGAGSARADNFIYTVTGLSFPGAGPLHTETFQFTSPTFLTSYTGLSAAQLDSCMNCTPSGTAVEFYPNGTLSLVLAADFVRFTDADGIVYGWFFSPNAFSTPGTYTGLNDPPFIVSDVSTLTVQATPEPSTLLLLALGLVALCVVTPIKGLFLSGRSS